MSNPTDIPDSAARSSIITYFQSRGVDVQSIANNQSSTLRQISDDIRALLK